MIFAILHPFRWIARIRGVRASVRGLNPDANPYKGRELAEEWNYGFFSDELVDRYE